MAKVAYVYHISFAILYSDGARTQADGVITRENPILRSEDYKTMKQDLLEEVKLNTPASAPGTLRPANVRFPSGIVITSLSLLHIGESE